jgi:PEP-CTERM motif
LATVSNRPHLRAPATFNNKPPIHFVFTCSTHGIRTFINAVLRRISHTGKKQIWLCSALLLFSSFGFAAPTLITGTPNFLGIGLSPVFGKLINFDDLATQVTNTATGFFPLPSGQYLSQGVASITNGPSVNPLFAAVFSQQSAPIYLTTGPNDNFAGNITISLVNPVNIIGIGILSDDSSPVTLSALGTTGNVLASFTVTTPSNSNTPANGYWAIQDTTNGIKGLQVVSSANLGIDDLQFAPEPSSFALIGAGILLVAFGALRRRVQ